MRDIRVATVQFQHFAGDKVYTLGAMGDLLCLEMGSGKVVWKKNFVKDYGAEKFFRDVKLCTIGEGTSEIQRLVIARHLIGH